MITRLCGARAGTPCLLLIALLLTGRRNGAGGELQADIILRKNFSETGRPARARVTSRPEERGRWTIQGPAQPPPADGGERGPLAVDSLVALVSRTVSALGASWIDAGTLYLPREGGGWLSLDNARFPLVDFPSGRRVILDPRGLLAEAARDARWPGYTTLALGKHADPRSLLGALLGAGGYAEVLVGTPVTFGNEVLVRLLPDYVVQQEAGTPLTGATYLLSSVADPERAIPPELREAAAERRLLILELLEGGAEASPWREPRGSLTTVHARHPALLLEELAGALGLTVERRVPLLPEAPGAAAVIADLRISRAGTATLVFFSGPEPNAARRLAERGEDVILLWRGAGVEDAVGRLLERFGIARIGPAVEFHKPAPDGAESRFSVTVPGWLADRGGGRRLLITKAALGPQIRLYLTREGIDLFEYAQR